LATVCSFVLRAASRRRQNRAKRLKAPARKGQSRAALYDRSRKRAGSLRFKRIEQWIGIPKSPRLSFWKAITRALPTMMRDPGFVMLKNSSAPAEISLLTHHDLKEIAQPVVHASVDGCGKKLFLRAHFFSRKPLALFL